MEEGTLEVVEEKDEQKNLTHVVVEQRGKKEDDELELEFRRICDGLNAREKPSPAEKRKAPVILTEAIAPTGFSQSTCREAGGLLAKSQKKSMQNPPSSRCTGNWTRTTLPPPGFSRKLRSLMESVND